MFDENDFRDVLKVKAVETKTRNGQIVNFSSIFITTENFVSDSLTWKSYNRNSSVVNSYLKD